MFAFHTGLFVFELFSVFLISLAAYCRCTRMARSMLLWQMQPVSMLLFLKELVDHAGMLPVEGSGQSRAGVLSRLDLVLDNPLASFETADTAVNRCSRIFRVCIACFIGRRTSGLSKHCCCRDFG
jgi:hypothetical protein